MKLELTTLSKLKLNHYFSLSGHKSILGDRNIAIISEIINAPSLLKKIKFPLKSDNNDMFYSFLNNGIQAINFFMKKVNTNFEEIVKYEKIKMIDLERILHSACVEKEINIIKFLLENTEVNIDYDEGALLRFASIINYKELIEYLLTSPKLKKNADIHADNDSLIRNCCQHGDLESLKFILSHPDLKDKIDLHIGNDFCFRNACINKHWEIVEYLIFEFKIPLTDTIKEFNEEYKNVKQMFHMRELKSNLTEEFNTIIEKTSLKRIKL